ncbi:hypothetical protein BHM03_00005858 [Ensete ventricosum]|nr:hypothetical protein BHM03_00005858 [Ensete ventricosum]
MEDADVATLYWHLLLGSHTERCAGVAVGPPPLTPVVQCRVDFKLYEVLPSLDDVIADALEELAEGDGLSATITSRVSVGISSGVVG